jgi:hypothetical protein
MPRTDINTILKQGKDSKAEFVDYTTPEQIEKLKQLRKESEQSLKNKEVNIERLRNFIIKR